MIPKKIQNSIWFNVLLLLVTVFLGMTTYKSVKQALQFKEETGDNKAKISELLEKKGELEMKIAEFQTLGARERLAKERLNLKKLGEEVVVVLPEDNPNRNDETENDSFWEKIKKIFKQ